MAVLVLFVHLKVVEWTTSQLGAGGVCSSRGCRGLVSDALISLKGKLAMRKMKGSGLRTLDGGL